MSLFAKFKAHKKKNNNKSDLPVEESVAEITPPLPSNEEAPPQVQQPPQTSPPSTGPSNSIFSGLHLSSKVSQEEASNSLCLDSDKQDEVSDDSTEEISSFSFLGNSEHKSDQKDELPLAKSSEITPLGFSFLQQPPAPPAEELDMKSNEDSLPGFSFLGQPSPAQELDMYDSIIPPSPLLTDQKSENLTSHHETDKLSSHSPPDSEEVEESLEKTKQFITGKKKLLSSGPKKRKRKAFRPGHDMNRAGENIVEEMTKSLDVSGNDDYDDDESRGRNDGDIVNLKQEETYPLPIPNEVATSSDKDLTKVGTLLDDMNDILSSETTPETITNDEESRKSVTDIPEITPCSPNINKTVSSSPVDGNYTVQFSHEETLAGLLQSYASGLSKLRMDLSEIEQKQKSKVLEQLELAQVQINRWLKNHLLHKKESKALAEEDYELAEMLNREMDAANVTTEQEICCASLELIYSWIINCSEEKESEIAFQKDTEAQLKRLREQHALALEQLRKGHRTILAKEKMQLQSLESEVERDAGHIGLDSSHLEKKEQMLEEETSRRAVNFISKKEMLVDELENVESEIDSLEEKLVILRNRKKEILTCISSEEERIKIIEGEMSEEREQLQAERAVLRERQDKLSFQQDIVCEKKIGLKTLEEKQNGERQSLEDLVVHAGVVWNEVENSKSLQDQNDKYVQDMFKLLDEGKKLLVPSEEILKIRSAVEMKKREMKEQTERILSGQKELGEMRKELRNLQAQVVHLQESKKAAVTGRQFKEAALLANDTKTMNIEIKSRQKALSEAEVSMATISKELAKLNDELIEMREKLSQLEKSEDETHIDNLLKAADILNSKEEGTPYLVHLVDYWKQLYLLLSDSLCAKHDLSSRNNPSIEDSIPCEERTPGVGMEENENIGVSTDGIDSSKTREDVRKRMAEIEVQIMDACQSEDYDLAAELEEELKSIQIHECTQ